MARSGLGRRTAFGTATLLIGANLPDVDVLAYFDGPAGDLSFRRGWTHGVPALLVLPFILTGFIMLADRLKRRVGREVLPSAVRPAQVLLLAGVSILSHPILDTLNTYGVRWLMPFRGDWYYGDTLFIVDPWVWLLLGAAVVASRRRRGARRHDSESTRPARVALGLSLCYVIGMMLSGVVARGIARRELTAQGGAVEQLMVAPRPLTPFLRQVVAARGDRYEVGTFRWLETPHVAAASLRSFPRPAPGDPLLLAAREQLVGRRFLGWARFPVVETDTTASGRVLVHLIDLRYANRADAGFGSVTLLLPDGVGPLSSTSSYSGSARLRRIRPSPAPPAPDTPASSP
jgi:inner membrane protein